MRAGVLPSPPSPSHGPPDAESVHSVYHADCHVEGPQERARAVQAVATAASLKLATGLGAMNYPTILPSAVSGGKGGTSPGLKGKRASRPPGAGRHSPLSLSSHDPYEKIQHLVGEHGKYPNLTLPRVKWDSGTSPPTCPLGRSWAPLLVQLSAFAPWKWWLGRGLGASGCDMAENGGGFPALSTLL